MLQTYERRPYASIALASVDCQTAVKKVTQPTLCLAGDADPFQKSTMRAAMLLPFGKFKNLGPAGCDVVDEFPEEYVREIANFIKVKESQLERASCTDISEKDNKVSTLSHQRFSERSSIGVLSPTTPLEGTVSRTSTEPEGETAPGERSRKSSDSDRRHSSERRRLSIKGIFKGKFLGE